MISVVGIFDRQEAAESAAGDLRRLAANDTVVQVLSPGGTNAQALALPLAASEQPGMAQTMGAFLGAVLGIAAGSALGTIGGLPLGYLLAALFGVAGAVGGGVVGRKLGNAAFEGLPEDELVFYKDAADQGQSVVICLAAEQFEADEARVILKRDGARDLDPARHDWRLGLERAERVHYEARPGIETSWDAFRQGVSAARSKEFHGKPWDQVVYLLAERFRHWYEDAFRSGFEAGQRS